MHKKLIICFAASYFTLKTLASLTVMPSLKKDVSTLSDDSKKHYDTVKKDRTIKGCISIFVGLLLGLLLYFAIRDNFNNNRMMCACIVLFTTFFSMQIVYEILWQNKFIFEYNNINNLKDDNTLNDVKIYAKSYKTSRFAMNIIEVSSISISLLLVLIYYSKLKK